MEENQHRLTSAKFLIAKLERLSADSYWAHQASGLRGSLLRAVEQAEAGEANPQRLDPLIERGFAVLERAAREIRSPDDARFWG